MRIEIIKYNSEAYHQACSMEEGKKSQPVREGLLESIQQAGGQLSDLWSRGINADCMREDADPDRLWLALAQHMMARGYHGEEFYEVREQWRQAPGEAEDSFREADLAWLTAERFHPVTGRKTNFDITLGHASDKAPLSDAWLLQDMLPAGGGVGIIGFSRTFRADRFVMRHAGHAHGGDRNWRGRTSSASAS